MDSLAQTITEKSISNDFNLFAEMFKIFAILILLILILYGLIFFLKKILRPMGMAATGKNIKMIETYYLSPKSKLILIQTGKKYLLISEKENQVNLLTELPADELDLSEGKNPKKSSPFMEILSRTRNKNE